MYHDIITLHATRCTNNETLNTVIMCVDSYGIILRGSGECTWGGEERVREREEGGIYNGE